MSTTDILLIGTATGIAAAAIVATFSVSRRLHRALKAERAWVDAVHHSDSVYRTLVEDLRREAELLSAESTREFGRGYLSASLVEVVDKLVAAKALSERDRRYILAGLRQQSMEGRRLYAHKLAVEAVGETPAPRQPQRLAGAH